MNESAAKHKIKFNDQFHTVLRIQHEYKKKWTAANREARLKQTGFLKIRLFFRRFELLRGDLCANRLHLIRLIG